MGQDNSLINADNAGTPTSKVVTLRFMSPEGVGSTIKADFINKTVEVENHTDVILFTAFGVVTNPTWKQFEEFLESRVVPKTRDRLEIALKAIGVPFWDPMLIIRKTEGRMLHDDFYIEIEE